MKKFLAGFALLMCLPTSVFAFDFGGGMPRIFLSAFTRNFDSGKVMEVQKSVIGAADDKRIEGESEADLNDSGCEGNNYEQINPDGSERPIKFTIESETNFVVTEGEKIKLVTNATLDESKGASDFYYWCWDYGKIEPVENVREMREVYYQAPNISGDTKVVKGFAQGGDGIGYIHRVKFEIKIVGKDNFDSLDPAPKVKFLPPYIGTYENNFVCYKVIDFDGEGNDVSDKVAVEIFVEAANGKYELAEKLGGSADCVQIEELRGGDPAYKMKIVASDGNKTSEDRMVFEVVPTCSVSGTVVNENGNVLDAWVSLNGEVSNSYLSKDALYYGYGNRFDPMFWRIEKYNFDGLAVGDYVMKAKVAGYTVDPVEVKCGKEQRFLEINMSARKN